MSVGEFLAKCQPLEVIALVAVLAVALVGLVALVVWRQVRLKQAVLALKQEAVQKGLSVAEIDDLISGTSLIVHTVTPKNGGQFSDANSVGSVAWYLGKYQFSAPELEHYLALVQAADSQTKQAIVAAFQQMNNLDKEHALAVIRGLCGTGGAERNARSIRPNTCESAAQSATESRALAEQAAAADRPRD
jgi:hypothetical protein